MTHQLQLDQFQSNFLMFCKGHYEGEDFWIGITKIYQEYYDYEELDLMGAYWMTQRIWKDYVRISGNEDHLREDYDSMTLPSENWKVWGGKKFNLWYNPDTDKFNNEDLIRARITAMVSQLGRSEIKYFAYLLPETNFAGLILKNPEYFQQTND